MGNELSPTQSKNKVRLNAIINSSVLLKGAFRYITMSAKNDFSYLHEIEENKDHNHVGCGVLTFPNGDVYTGQWRGDFFHGQGEMQFQNGSSYSGRWFQSEFCGHGVFKSGTNGCIYEGGFINSAFNGHGMMMYPNGDIYEGEWRNDKKVSFILCFAFLLLLYSAPFKLKLLLLDW